MKKWISILCIALLLCSAMTMAVSAAAGTAEDPVVCTGLNFNMVKIPAGSTYYVSFTDTSGAAKRHINHLRPKRGKRRTDVQSRDDRCHLAHHCSRLPCRCYGRCGCCHRCRCQLTVLEPRQVPLCHQPCRFLISQGV